MHAGDRRDRGDDPTVVSIFVDDRQVELGHSGNDSWAGRFSHWIRLPSSMALDYSIGCHASPYSFEADRLHFGGGGAAGVAGDPTDDAVRVGVD